MKNRFILLAIMTLVCFSFVCAQESEQSIHLHIFYGQGCSHCEKALDFLTEQKEGIPGLEVSKHEVYFNKTQRELLGEMIAAFGEKIEGVPTIFIDNKIFVGFSNSISESLEEEIARCVKSGCDDPLDKIVANEETVKLIGDSSTAENPEETEIIRKLTVPAVIAASIVDAINPCAFAVLIILISTILISTNRRKALAAGLAFSLSIFISYFLMGIGLYSAIQVSGISHTFYMVVAVLAILVGIFNLKDYMWYGKWFVTEVPLKWRPKLQYLIKSVTSIPGAFAIGFIVSLFLLPCTSGPYIVILGLLAEATIQSYAILLLAIYNLIFILPMILITLAIFFGFTTTEKAEKLRKVKLRTLHLIAGIIISCLGIGMLLALYLGII